MTGHFRFLIVDDTPDGLYLLAKTLLRCFPKAILHSCVDAAAARAALARHAFSVVIVHRARGVDGLQAVAGLRETNRKVPIVHLSWLNRADESAVAGATRFLSYDAWPQLGNVVADLLPRQVAPVSGAVPLSPSDPQTAARELDRRTEEAS